LDTIESHAIISEVNLVFRSFFQPSSHTHGVKHQLLLTSRNPVKQYKDDGKNNRLGVLLEMPALFANPQIELTILWVSNAVPHDSSVAGQSIADLEVRRRNPKKEFKKLVSSPSDS
jgi:hypothetical protein